VALYIGGGSATATRTTGPIIIGADSTASGGINIGTDTDLAVPTDNTINIGSASYATIVKGSLSVVNGLTVSGGNSSITSGGAITGTSIISPSLNAAAVSTNVDIATTQTSGDLNIGTGARTTAGEISIGTGSGAINNVINIGGANSRTTLGGYFYNSVTGYIAGISPILSMNSNTLPFTISTSVMRDYLVRFTGTASGTMTVPAGYPDGQRITVKNTGSGTITVTFTGGIYATGATATSASISLAAGGFVSAINLGSSWIQT
jgi:hypothetical protein